MATAERKPNGSELVLTSPQTDTMLTVIERAVMSPEFDVNKLKELLELRERYEAAEAKRAFVQALSTFKSRAVQVAKDKINPQYNSRYVSLGNLVNSVTPILSQHGLSCRWDIDQSAGIKVTCIMTHVEGHSESVAMVCPPDDSGKKNPIQQIKSAITYAKACTFESICGLASTDSNLDDDGNGITNGDVTERIEYLQNCRTLEELKGLFGNYFREFNSNKPAQKAIQGAYEAKKAELSR